MKKKKKLIQRALRSLELPTDVIPNMTKLEIIGNKEILIENCKGIKEYDENMIKLNAGKFPITILGANMVMSNMFENVLSVYGDIFSIDFKD